MGKKKQSTTINQTTSPTVAEPYKTELAGFTNAIGDFMDMDPTQFVAPPSTLQTQAFSDAQNLGGWQPYLDWGAYYAQQAADAPASQVQAYGYQAPDVPDANLFSGAQLSPAAQYGGTTLGPAYQTQSAQLGSAPLAQSAQLGSATGYSAPQIGNVAGPTAYQAAQTNIGSSPSVNLQGYGLPQLGQASQVGSFGYNAALADPSQYALADPSKISDFMGNYQNPYTQQVINATLADFDEDAGRREAQLAAQGAIGGAFGGSRFGIAEGQLQGELARGRASTEAALLDQQYRLAAQLGQFDAGTANQFALERAGMGLNTALANQASLNQAGQFNATNALQSALSNQQANNQFSLANFGAGIDAARYGADAANQSQLANQALAQQFAMAQFGADTQRASQFADALNVASQMGFQGDLQTALAQAGFDADSARYFADQVNQFTQQQGAFDQQANLANQAMLGQYGLTQGSLDQQANLANQDAINNFLMQQGLFDQQTGMANMDAINQFAIQQGLLDQQTGQYNTDALNNFLMTQVGLDADSARYYADALNQAEFQNANLQEQEYLRQLQAAGLMGDISQLYGTQSLADLGMTADLGTLQRSLEAEYLNAYPTQLQLAGNLYSQLSPALYSGSTTTGKNTTSQSGGWLAPLAGSALQAGAMVFSDERLKRDIVTLRVRPDGLAVKEWSWRNFPDAPRERGFIAQEVREIYPEAVVENYRGTGYLGLNYALIPSETADV